MFVHMTMQTNDNKDIFNMFDEKWWLNGGLSPFAMNLVILYRNKANNTIFYLMCNQIYVNVSTRLDDFQYVVLG